jgi:hypothetical protein
MKIIRRIGGTILWGASAAISIIFFYQIAHNSIQEQILAGLLAVGFEIAKITLWQSGGFKRVISIPFILLSLFASMLAALGVVDSYRTEIATSKIESSIEFESAEFRKAQLQSQIQILTARLQDMPRDWPTRATQLSSEISALRLELAKVDTAHFSRGDSELSAQVFVSDVFDVAANYLDIPIEMLLMASLLLIAILTEVGAIALFEENEIRTKSSEAPESGGPDRLGPESPELILSGDRGDQSSDQGVSGKQATKFTRPEDATPESSERIISSGLKSQIPLHLRIELYMQFLNALCSNGAANPGDRIFSRDDAARISGVTSHKAKGIINRLSQAGILYKDGRFYHLKITKEQAIRKIQRAK